MPGGSSDQIKFLVPQGCICLLCDLLDVPDPNIVTIALKGLENSSRLEMPKVEQPGSIMAANNVEVDGLEK